MDTVLGLRADIFRIIVSQVLCLPLGIFYNAVLANKSPSVKHWFNFITGLSVCYYNCGGDTVHSLITCLVVYASIKLLGPTQLMVGLNFLFVMFYLLGGYFQKEWYSVDQFTWTLPQCVLSLALIALSYDVYDGAKNVRNKAKDVKLVNLDTALEKTPSLLETMGKMYFMPTFLIGPQVGFKEYLEFTDRTKDRRDVCITPSIQRLIVSLCYFAAQMTGAYFLPQSLFVSEEFASWSFWKRFVLLALSNKLIICKYISAWSLSEAGCIMYGISSNPDTGEVDRCYNMRIVQYETAATFRSLIQSFNVGTNNFAMRYIFKRLAWAGSKFISQIVTVGFLALWHGFMLGYYNTFALEIVMVIAERDWEARINNYRQKNQWLDNLLKNDAIETVIRYLMRLNIVLMFGYAFTSFGYLRLADWNYILYQLYYVGHLIYFGWIPLSILLKTKR